MAPTYVGSFHLRGRDLRAQGLNRVGNMLVPNSNYCAFEDWIMPILDAMLLEQQQGMHWTPSKVRQNDCFCQPAALQFIPRVHTTLMLPV